MLAVVVGGYWSQLQSFCFYVFFSFVVYYVLASVNECGMYTTTTRTRQRGGFSTIPSAAKEPDIGFYGVAAIYDYPCCQEEDGHSVYSNWKISNNTMGAPFHCNHGF